MTARWSEIRAAIAASEVVVGAGVSEEQILQAESQLGRFPDDYRQLLREFGWVSVGSLEFYGLGDDVPSFLNVFEMTLLERRSPAGFPDFLVALRNDGGGNSYCYDSRELSDDPPVRFWSHDAPDEMEIESPTFSAWFLSEITGETT